jgi:hypothetical protein
MGEKRLAEREKKGVVLISGRGNLGYRLGDDPCWIDP